MLFALAPTGVIALSAHRVSGEVPDSQQISIPLALQSFCAAAAQMVNPAMGRRQFLAVHGQTADGFAG